MPFVKCSVDGCSRKLQPIVKVDPKDRETWFYRECDVCFKPACEKHSSEVGGRIICDRCRREAEAKQESEGLIDLGFRLLVPLLFGLVADGETWTHRGTIRRKDL